MQAAGLEQQQQQQLLLLLRSCTDLSSPAARPQVARSSDFGRNDQVFFCRTHLGHLLQPGDLALGYDLANANYVGMDFEKHVAKGGRVPDVILVRKSYEEKRRKKRVGGPRGRGQCCVCLCVPVTVALCVEMHIVAGRRAGAADLRVVVQLLGDAKTNIHDAF
jgi:hypothetical protein